MGKIMAYTRSISRLRSLPTLSLLINTLLLIALLSTCSLQLASAQLVGASLSNSQLSSSTSLSISEVSVLLSWKSGGTILRATGDDCPTWYSTDPDLLAIVPAHFHSLQHQHEQHHDISNSATRGNVFSDEKTSLFSTVPSCAKEVRVIPLGYHDKRKSALVIAESRDTAQSVQCEVFVDHIDDINIMTTAKQLVVGDLEMLEVQARDREGNVFTSLTGLDFKWGTRAVHSDDTDVVGAIQLLALDDPSVKLSIDPTLVDTRKSMASSFIIAKGLTVGRARVSARLIDPMYAEVQPAVSEFVVRDHFVLEPSALLRLLPGSVVQYVLKKKIGKEMHVIDMSEDKYEWESSQEVVGVIDKQMGTFQAGSQLGRTDIVVRDKSFPLNSANGLVYVVHPDKIVIKIRPVSDHLYLRYPDMMEKYADVMRSRLDPSNLVQGVLYDVDIEVYDRYGQKIYITDNVKFNLSVASDRDGIVKIIAKEGHKMRIETKEIGSVVLRAELLQARNDLTVFDGKLHVEQEVFIYPRISVEYPQPTIHLPVDTNPVTQQMFQPRVSGGSGQYLWIAFKAGPITVDGHQGTVRTRSEGESELVVVDATNFFNGDMRAVSVSVAASVEFQPSVRETSIGSTLRLPIIVRDARGNAFANFTALNLHCSVMDSRIYEIQRQGDHCVTDGFLQLSALSEGFTNVRVRYKGHMQDRTLVAAFPPLEILEPVENPMLIPMGTEANITLTGGPRPWDEVLYKSTINDAVTVPLPKQVSVVPLMRSPMKRIYSVTCFERGTQDFSFTITHEISMEGALPTVVSVEKPFSCQTPSTIRIIPTQAESGNELHPIPVAHAMNRVYNVRNDQVLALQIRAFDEHGNRFSAIDSLIKNWGLEHPQSRDKIVAKFLKGAPNMADIDMRRGRQLLDIAAGEEGIVLVTAEVPGYNEKMLTRHHLKPGPIRPAITDMIELRVTSSVYLTPSFLVLFKSTDVSAVLTATGGSGRFDFSLNNTRIARYSVLQNDVSLGNKIELVGMAEGYVQVSVSDLQFAGAAPAAHSVVKIADIHRVELSGVHFVQVGHTITLTLSIMDELDNLFSSSQHVAMDPKVEIDHPKFATIDLSNRGTVALQGVGVGTVKLVASAVNSQGRRIFSKPFAVTVFAPMRVDPPQLILVPGAKYQVAVVGGLSAEHGSTKFKMVKHTLNRELTGSGVPSDTHVATTNNRGVVVAVNYGESMLVVEKWLGQELVARISVPVFVVQLSALSVPKRLSVFAGNTVPLSIAGTSTAGIVTPLSLQSPHVTITYAIDETSAADFTEPLSTTGHMVPIQGIAPGKASVSITMVFRHPTFASYRHTATVPIAVEDRLAFVRFCHEGLLLAPTARYHLETSKNTPIKASVLTSSDYESAFDLEGDHGDILVARDVNSGTGVVIIEDVITTHKLSMTVEVQPPHFLTLFSAEALRWTAAPRRHVLYLPVGSSSRWDILALNQYGEEFATINAMDVELRSNYHDAAVISLDHAAGTLNIHAHSVGNSTLELSSAVLHQSSSAARAFHFEVRVLPALQPYDVTVHVGALIDYSVTDLFAPMLEHGTWQAQDESVIKVDRTGRAIAIGTGTTKVGFKSTTTSSSGSDDSGNSIHLTTYAPIRVVKVAVAQFIESPGSRQIVMDTSAPQSSQRTYKFPVALFDQFGNEFVPHPHHSSTTESEADRIVQPLEFKFASRSSLVDMRSEADPNRPGHIVCVVTPNVNAMAHLRRSNPNLDKKGGVEMVPVVLTVRVGEDVLSYDVDMGTLSLLVSADGSTKGGSWMADQDQDKGGDSAKDTDGKKTEATGSWFSTILFQVVVSIVLGIVVVVALGHF